MTASTTFEKNGQPLTSASRHSMPIAKDAATAPSPRSRPASGSMLPPIPAMLARPLVLIVSALIGGGVGLLATGGTGFTSTAAVEFTVESNDVALVSLEGRTLANRAVSNEVLQRASTAIGEPVNDLADNVAADWRTDSMLVNVTATGPTPESAGERANAVAEATVDVLRDGVNARLGAATSQANAMLGEGAALPDPEAESARRTQVGSALAERQNSLKDQSDSVFVAVPATEVEPAGTPKVLGLAIGLAAGLFAGCLIAVLLGSRWMRAWSASTLRRLAPGVDVLAPSQAAQLVGQIVQDGDTYVAVVATPGSGEAADDFAGDLTRLLSNHGKTATIIRPPAVLDAESAELLRADVPGRVRELVGTDVLIAIVPSGSESAAMLEGRSGLRTVVLLRRRRTPVADGLAATAAYAQSAPVLVLAD